MEEQEYIAGYAKKSGVSVEELMKTQICLPCHCGYVGCKGFAMVSNNPHAIKSHNDLYVTTSPKS